MLSVILAFLTTASDGFRCPDTSRLISTGDHTVMVVRKCREPDGRASHVETKRHQERIRRYYRNGIAYDEIIERETEIVVEDWTYDFGPSRFVRFLRFENDVLVRVADGSYGTK